uniref:Putative secreted peptide n=1 Tax=Anopheles braziliensis TaxID=58242 RepID=A0A2M3ZPY4_9DIPT
MRTILSRMVTIARRLINTVWGEYSCCCSPWSQSGYMLWRGRSVRTLLKMINMDPPPPKRCKKPVYDQKKPLSYPIL